MKIKLLGMFIKVLGKITLPLIRDFVVQQPFACIGLLLLLCRLQVLPRSDCPPQSGRIHFFFHYPLIEMFLLNAIHLILIFIK